jgi:prophage maintenance system killer protein
MLKSVHPFYDGNKATVALASIKNVLPKQAGGTSEK